MILFTLITTALAQASECRWQPETLQRFKKSVVADFLVGERKTDQEIWFFEIPNTAVLHSLKTPKDNAFLNYRQFVQSKVNTNQDHLIRRQNSLFQRAPQIYAESIHSSQQVLKGKIGQIRASNCLENLMLTEHVKRMPVQKGPTEYAAHVLFKGKKLRILFLSGDDLTVHFHDEIKQYLEASLKEGWKGFFHIHSHPFAISSNQLDVIGTVAPSDPDYNVFNNFLMDYKFTSGRITNGFNTFNLQLTPKNLESVNTLRKLPLLK